MITMLFILVEDKRVARHRGRLETPTNAHIGARGGKKKNSVKHAGVEIHLQKSLPSF